MHDSVRPRIFTEESHLNRSGWNLRLHSSLKLELLQHQGVSKRITGSKAGGTILQKPQGVLLKWLRKLDLNQRLDDRSVF